MTAVGKLSAIVLLTGCFCAAVADERPAAPGVSGGLPDPQQLAFFESKIRPVLVQHCYKCHSAESKDIRGGLLVDSRQGLLVGGDSGAAVVPGDPAASQLLLALRHESVEMPPDRRLPDSVIADFEQWIKSGAADPREGVVQRVRSGVDVETGRQFWSFQPVQRPTVPAVGSAWARNEIDNFIEARLNAGGLQAPADASPEVILRRLTWVLTGLLPEREQQQSFAARWAQDQDAAIAETVDQLLRSPRYGERWGRHWLDVVRFAESTGGGRSMMLPDAWRFRDYVICAINADKPLPQLIREHIAGDLLPFETDEQHDEQAIGAGYLMLGAINYEEQDKEQLRMDVVDEQIDSIGRTFLGMTLGCARCHDHKFDPIPTADYYALAGIFRSTRSLTPGNVCGWVTKPLRQGIDQAALSAWQERDKQLEQQIATLKRMPSTRKTAAGRAVPVSTQGLPGIVIDDGDAVLEGEWVQSSFQRPFLGEGYRHSGMPRTGLKAVYTVQLPDDGEYLVRMVINHGTSRSDRVPLVVRHADGETQLAVSQRMAAGAGGFTELGRFSFSKAEPAIVAVLAADAAPGHVIIDALHFIRTSEIPPGGIVAPTPTASPTANSGDTATQLRQLEADRKAHAKAKPAIPVAMCVEDEPAPGDWHQHIRGEIRNLGPIVPRGFLKVATPATHSSAASIEGRAVSGRRELAEWLASPDNPLTARVFVNRLWLNVMGEGLVRTPDNFGQTGDRPTHPELLDWLAAVFVTEDSSSTRAMLRRLCTSRTFRMSSAETSQVLQADPENRLWSRAVRRRMDAESLRDCLLQTAGTLDLSISGGPRIAKLGTYDNEYRHEDHPMFCRSIYVPVFRNTMLDLFEVFDAANPNSVTGRRIQSNRPSQALYMLNSPFVTEQARSASERLLRQSAAEGLSPDATARRAVEICLGRAAAEQELQLLIPTPETANSVDHWAAIFHALYSSVDFRYID
ncbi:MAG: Xanthan lyase precursor [Planctomycetota bacterium]